MFLISLPLPSPRFCLLNCLLSLLYLHFSLFSAHLLAHQLALLSLKTPPLTPKSSYSYYSSFIFSPKSPQWVSAVSTSCPFHHSQTTESWFLPPVPHRNCSLQTTSDYLISKYNGQSLFLLLDHSTACEAIYHMCLF